MWLTGLPASGKSALARELVLALEARGLRPAVLESDAVRPILTPSPTYDDAERDAFYRTLGWAAGLLADHGVPAIVDATANLRRYRDLARARITRFLEVHVECPLAVCMARDPKGIYRRGVGDPAGRVPGLHVPYEPPLAPEVTTDGRAPAGLGARAVLTALEARGWLEPADPSSR